VHRQQSILLYATTRSIPDRIVIPVQRQVRPIVRGDARAAVEFGAKISVSVRNSFALLHRINLDPNNEGEDLIPQAKKYKHEDGCDPERICADRIYSIPKIETSAPRTTYAYLASDWAGLRRIPRSIRLISNSSVQTNGGETRWRASLDQGSGSIHYG